MPMSDNTSIPKPRTPAQLAADAAHRERMKGNSNARNGRAIRDALRRALYKRDPATGERYLRIMAERMVKDAALGLADPSVINVARREIADRIDGKPSQQVDIGAAAGTSISIVIEPADANTL